MPEAQEATTPAPETAAEWLQLVQKSEREGELFRAYDLARTALWKFKNDLALKHRAVLCLASTGATQKAIEACKELGLDRAASEVALGTRLEMDVAALRPRLLKDAALTAAIENRPSNFAAAAEAYETLYRAAKAAGNGEAYYPGVNAATMNLLAGNDSAAIALAREILDVLAARPSKKGFYEIATELEANLVIGDLVRARDSVQTVRAAVRDKIQADYRGQAAMLRQLRLIIEKTGIGLEILEALAPPRVIHYLGHIIAAPGKPGRFQAEQEAKVQKAILEVLDKHDVGFGYGSLAAGADILFAEALLERGASLHVVLPFNLDDFVEISVRCSGDDWVPRFERCLDAAKENGSVRYATDGRYLDDDHLFGYCSQLAMGLALLRAKHLSTAVEQIVVWDGQPASGPAGTAADIARWRRTGAPQNVIPVDNGFHSASTTRPRKAGIERRTLAMLFGDIHGFSKLTDEQLPAFIDRVLGAFARVVRENRGDILLANTWGDGLFLVFEDAGKAARGALALQDALSLVDNAAYGLPDHMGLRIGLHLGPAYTARDPILERDNYFGAHVSRAARIEPVTPEGCIYVTETMAAVLALHNADEFKCEYVGMTDAAKKYGAMRMFLLQRT
jgi:class 3 adenylate cyclase